MSETVYESGLAKLWRQAIDPDNIGMPQAIAQEIASYTAQSVEDVLDCMSRGKEDLKLLWDRSNIDPSDSSRIAAFYRDQFVEAYELAEWHSGRLNGHPPLNYAHAATLAKAKGFRRALDFGSGIGSGALCLAIAGCRVDCADVSNTLLGFVGHRLKQRGLSVQLIDLMSDQTPPRREYDLITCFDVLEHIPDQQAQLRKLQSYLRPGGYLLLNLLPNAFDPERPMHVSSAPNWLAMIRSTSMVPDWSWFRGGADHIGQALVYQRWGRLRNMIGSCVDRYQASTAKATVRSVPIEKG